MRAVIQRVTKASVSVDNQTVGAIETGLLVLLGVTHDDTIDDVAYLVKKISQLRIFEDDQEKMNLDIRTVNGKILSISQFTLYADTKKGNRPSFVDAANPSDAQILYNHFNQELLRAGITVEKGIFGANMQVTFTNDGPVTIMIDSKHK